MRSFDFKSLVDNLMQPCKTGSHPHPTVFFEPKPGVQPKAKATGHNCKALQLQERLRGSEPG